ncbi:MAG: hypothetical protein ACKVW3_11305 [Phycisphaerales bacterium]
MTMPAPTLRPDRKARPAWIVRALAGIAASSRQTRRGTVLILVLGALALIAVITIVYVTVGQGDRRTSDVTTRRDSVDQMVERIGEHLAGVIGDDTFATGTAGSELDPTSSVAGARSPILVREAADFPFTDPFCNSILAPFTAGTAAPTPHLRPDDAGRRFVTEGSFGSVLRDMANQPLYADPRLPSDPWLAATMPTALFRATGNPNVDDITNYTDWFHISNISPDGRYVNLWNLRGNFDATSTMTIRRLNINGQMRLVGDPQPGSLSYGLTLLDPNGRPTQKLPFAANFNGPPTGLTDPERADPNIPAHWSTWQQRMFFSARGPIFYPPPFLASAPPGPGYTQDPNRPDDPRYAPYIYADADGDTFMDSRWQELVDASDPWGLSSVLPRDGRYRWFVAARVMDLSALVNLNTATEYRTPARATIPAASATVPRSVLPAGLTAADVDLRRLLMMIDNYSLVPALSNANLPAPYASPPGGDLGYQLLVRGVPPIPTTDQGDLSQYTAANARAVGSRAYNALRRVMRPEQVLVPSAGTNVTAGPVNDPITIPTADERYANAARFGAPQEASVTFTQIPNSNPPRFIREMIAASPLDHDDLLELLTYWTCNDPNTLSRLEQILDGRFDANNTGNNATSRYGPMRSNRPASLERDSNDKYRKQGNSFILGANNEPSPDGLADPMDLARTHLGVRQLITTDGGARPIRSSVISSADQFSLSDSVDRAINAPAALRAARGNPLQQPFDTPTLWPDRDHRQVFAGYAQALLPYSWRFGAWTYPLPGATSPTNPWLGPLNYGKRAELALRTAASITANAIDSFDRDDQPSAFTLLITGTPADLAAVDANSVAFPWWKPRPAPASSVTQRPVRPGSLDLDYDLGVRRTNNDPGGVSLPASRLAPGTANLGTDRSGIAVNIFGIEAQPFVTQAMSMVFYTDSPNAGNEPEITTWIQIEGAYDGGAASGTPPNPDYLGEIVAFQLTNPFDQPVYLTTPSDGVDPATSSRSPTFCDGRYSQFYLEFNRKLFKIAEQVDDTGTNLNAIILQPGETVVLYSTSHPLAELQTRWRDAARNNVLPTPVAPVACTGLSQAAPMTIVESIIQNQLSTFTLNSMGTPVANGCGRRAIRIPRMDPVTGRSDIAADEITGGPDSDKQDVRLWRTMRSAADASPDIQAPVAGNVPRIPLPCPRAGNETNLRFNDMLADRLRDPVFLGNAQRPRATLDRRLPPGSNDVTGAQPNSPDDDGFSIVFWGSIKRSDDPHPPQPPNSTGAREREPLPRGALPAYCLEAKWGSNSLDNRDFPARVASLNDTLFRAQPNAADTDLNAFAAKLANPNTGVIPNLRINRLPQQKNAFIPPPNPPHSLGNNNDAPPRPYHLLYPEITLNNGEFTSTFIEPSTYPPTPGNPIARRTISVLRVSDLLLPLGIAPLYLPNIASVSGSSPNTSTPAPDPDRCLTLSEALGLALNYSNPPAGDQAWGIYANIGNRYTGALDRGQLVLDRFAPYEETTPTGRSATLFDPEALPAARGSDDIRRFPGIPLGLHIMNVFSASEEGGIDRLVPGLINANTAPPAVARVIPMLTPTPEIDPVNGPLWDTFATNSGIVNPYLGTPRPSSTLPQRPQGTNPGSDIAATLQAYRDKIPLINRNGTIISFFDFPANAPLTPRYSFDPDTWIGRLGTTSIGGIRETPGFGSPAEIMAAIDRTADGSTASSIQGPFSQRRGVQEDKKPTPGQVAVPFRSQIDHLAYENSYVFSAQPFGLPSGVPGTNATLYKGLYAPIAGQRFQQPGNIPANVPPPANSGLTIQGACSLVDAQGVQTCTAMSRDRCVSLRGVYHGDNTTCTAGAPGTTFSPPLVISEVPDAFADKLVVASAASGSISVRSDVYAVWFIIHGYQRGDTLDLGPDDPLVPSIARRFLMIVDRSNVTRKGDKPKVLLFKELPL